MKLYSFLVLFLLLTNTHGVFAESAPSSQGSPVSGTRVLEQKLDYALSLLEKGEYIQAQKIYEEMLKNKTLSSEQRQGIRQAHENLNMRLLFSRIQTQDSFFYTVVQGDSLYKIAVKHETTVALIKKTNGLNKDTIYPGMKLKITRGEFSVNIDKSENTLTLRLNDRVMKHYEVATGTDNGTPTGPFTITNKLENPTWYKAGAIVLPDSPENALGTRWLGFDYPGYGIHGTIAPDSIGSQSTSGCVRMLNKEVEELYTIIPTGTSVMIID